MIKHNLALHYLELKWNDVTLFSISAPEIANHPNNVEHREQPERDLWGLQSPLFSYGRPAPD